MEGLDPAVQALGEAGHVLDRDDRDACPGELLGGGAGRDDLDAGRGQGLAELLQTCLVVDGHQGSLDGEPLGRCGHRTFFRGWSGRWKSSAAGPGWDRRSGRGTAAQAGGAARSASSARSVWSA
ncbi:hypothetical protein SDC9_212625 [bioreactor metagenome]|uniref:Uncharacterized protein n=1 Tax=bioreactor metagenome TaxID=1076179 RepID=A0A645JNC7_9ZZZZ